MDNKVVDLLVEALNKVDLKVDKLDEKVTEMLAFKWQIVGGSLVVSIIVGAAIQIFLAVAAK